MDPEEVRLLGILPGASARMRTTTDDGEYEIVSKGGHRAIRFAIQEEKFRYEGHDSLHASIASAGCLAEFRGHMRGYGAIDIADENE